MAEIDFKIVDVWDELSSLNPKDVSKRSGAVYNFEENCYLVKVLDQTFNVYVKERCIEKEGKNCVEKAPWQPQIFIPIYLVNAKNQGLEGRLISPRELNGGDLFFAASTHQIVFNDLLKKYPSPKEFKKAGSAIGGQSTSYGDASFWLLVLPRIPLHFVYHIGGDEFPNRINVFFDASARRHLPTDSLWLTIEYSRIRLMDVTE